MRNLRHRRRWIRRRFAAGRRGTIKVVTGAGKTLLALAIAERLQREDPDLRAAVVVPTIVLMEQWYATLRERSNLPDGSVGEASAADRFLPTDLVACHDHGLCRSRAPTMRHGSPSAIPR
ncbi:MAG: DEAD/DEAH box helicase family protein [Solirubrobacteraceae bacterium]